MAENEKKSNSGRGCLNLIIILAAICFFVFAAFPNLFKEKEKSEPVTQILYAPKYNPDATGHNISAAEFIEKNGQPDSQEDWNMDTGLGTYYQMTTLTYGNYDYIFSGDNLQRISIYEPLSYKKKSDFLNMFGLNEYKRSTILDTGVAYKAQDCGVYELYILYDDAAKQIDTVQISYSDIFGNTPM